MRRILVNRSAMIPVRFFFCLPALAAAAALTGLCSCVSSPSHQAQLRNPRSDYYTQSWDGRRTGNSRPHEIVIRDDVLASVTPDNARIEIDLGAQKARLYRIENGRRRVAVETDISTGSRDLETPTGSFKITEKSRHKESTLYGSWVNARTGGMIEPDGDSRRRPRSSQPLEFRGAPMPYWLRLTSGGIGMHEGFVPDYPASHGCIRVPPKAQPLIYRNVRVGTPVTVVD